MTSPVPGQPAEAPAAPRRRTPRKLAKPPVTDPAAKYGPTPLFGLCESRECDARARRRCESCEGHFCLAHVHHGSC